MEPPAGARKHRLSDVNSPDVLVHQSTSSSHPPSKRPNNNLHHPAGQALSHKSKSPAAEPARTSTTTSTAVISVAEVVTPPTTTTLLIDGHKFFIPKDPFHAFRATSAQTIASLRSVWAGTPRARDQGFLFGATLATEAGEPVVCGGLSISQPIFSKDSGTTREFDIDTHIFNIPTDEVAAFLVTRGMTMASFRRVVEGRAGARDMALVSGTPTVRVSEEATSGGKVAYRGSAPAYQGGETDPPSRVQRTSRGVDKDDNRHADENYDQGGEADRDRSEGDEEDEGNPAPVRSAPTTHAPGTSPTHDAQSAVSNLPTTKSLPTVPVPTVPRPQAPLYTPTMREPYGDFSSFRQAMQELNRSKSWCMGTYINGRLSLGGVFAKNLVSAGKARCTPCTMYVDRGGRRLLCTVLVGEDPWIKVAGNRYGPCGFCVWSGESCDVDEKLKV